MILKTPSLYPASTLSNYIPILLFTLFFFFLDFIYLFLDRVEGREKDRSINMWLPLMRPLLGTWPATQGMCPDWESNRGPYAS